MRSVNDALKAKPYIKLAHEALIAETWAWKTKKQDLKNKDSLKRLERNFSRFGELKTNLYNYRLDLNGLVSKGTILNSRECEFLTTGASSPYHIGVELEVEGLTEENQGNVADVLDDYLSDSHVVTSDGSLDSTGAEIVTIPLPARRFDQVRWYRLLKGLSRLGLKSHDSPRCGLHVHISRDYLKEKTWFQVHNFVLKYKEFFKAISRRRGNDPFYFCQFVRDRQQKYRAVNFQHATTIEFRFLHGTLNALTFLAGVNAIRSLVEVAKEAESRNGRITVKAYKEKLLDHYACRMRYQEPANNFLKASAVSVTEGSRVRRSLEEVRSDTVRALASLTTLQPSEVTIQNNTLLLNYERLWWITGIRWERETHESPVWRTYSLRFNRFPARLRRDLARLGVTQVTIFSKLQSLREEAVLNYYRGTYGRHSRAFLSI